MISRAAGGKSMAEIAWVPIVVALIGVAGSLGVAWITASRTVSDVKAGSIGSQSSGQKLCRVVVPDMYTDSLIVPQAWKPDACRLFSLDMKARYFQLGCVYDTKIAWGDLQGRPPSENCGW